MGVIVLAPGLSARILAQEVDLQKAVHCATLSQQFGAWVKTAQVEDDVNKAAADVAKQTDRACMAHEYDAGPDQRRQALQQIGTKPII